ncbi:hypothetical protein WH87_16490 [Devosia epidermidihirudinis]|uniref:Uncharacterized protein n=1 Tax=Devosia epidermidihirudinis TaxID=1293439 RepID=A0A0F5Q415_9HYPH|nr:hypothetical protein WH87_16490 [Devosia epidermidihirudinis]
MSRKPSSPHSVLNALVVRASGVRGGHAMAAPAQLQLRAKPQRHRLLLQPLRLQPPTANKLGFAVTPSAIAKPVQQRLQSVPPVDAVATPALNGRGCFCLLIPYQLIKLLERP